MKTKISKIGLERFHGPDAGAAAQPKASPHPTARAPRPELLPSRMRGEAAQPKAGASGARAPRPELLPAKMRAMGEPHEAGVGKSAQAMKRKRSGGGVEEPPKKRAKKAVAPVPTMDCNTIEWLVDLLGTIGLLAYVISDEDETPNVEDVSGRGPRRTAFGRGDVEDGLYFDGAHWYSIKDHEKRDSYTEGYQVKGTAHFCQTFAAMIFTGADVTYGLKAKDYSSNIKKAVKFWLDSFGDQKLLRYFVKEVKTSAYKDQLLFGTSTKLEKITAPQLRAFLSLVSRNSATFVGCKQG